MCRYRGDSTEHSIEISGDDSLSDSALGGESDANLVDYQVLGERERSLWSGRGCGGNAVYDAHVVEREYHAGMIVTW